MVIRDGGFQFAGDVDRSIPHVLFILFEDKNVYFFIHLKRSS